MAIRRANKSETNYILYVLGRVLKESTMGYAENNVQHAYNLFYPMIQKGAYFLIDEENRKLKGWILLGVEWNSITNELMGCLISVYVYPEYRKTGLGEKLTVAAINELRGMGIRTVQVNVFNGNPSRILCEKLGFKPVSAVMELKM
ncbi:GNAT family N-acetyltransferase [Mesobacillus subterraneus]|uniref:GNAT family N-acetyltransferase n=1 Tax=Mesobacillus subterraneus TaxID=285983 RepID=A0A427TL05_9BACI|nr:GNAT family N-acetyltransferase [Mesobacillus subterraneus]RSD25097.1 GNAT family N-acetyltransferase [Mesobacillus subterraneus]